MTNSVGMHHHPPELPLVYLAGPITLNPLENTAYAMDLWNDLMLDGKVVPWVPHWSILQQIASPRTHEAWIIYCKHILRRCDALYRYPADDPSPGADIEVDYMAYALHKPVFTELELLYEWADTYAITRRVSSIRDGSGS